MNSKEIQCLNRLIKLTACYGTILDFLLQEKVIDKVDYPHGDKDKAFHLYNLLENGKEKETLILVTYEWKLLPIEYINLTLISKMTRKEFTYDEP